VTLSFLVVPDVSAAVRETGFFPSTCMLPEVNRVAAHSIESRVSVFLERNVIYTLTLVFSGFSENLSCAAFSRSVVDVLRVMRLVDESRRQGRVRERGEV